MVLIKQIAGLFIAATLFSSCVSNKKYNEAVNAGKMSEQNFKSSEEAYNNLKAETARLDAELRRIKETSSAELAASKRDIDEKDKTLQELKDMITTERNAIQNLKKEVCDALKCYTPDELTIDVRNGKLYVSMSDKLLFPSGSDEVNVRGKEAVTTLAKVLTNSTMEIMVEGHTDSIPINNGRNKDNWDLSAHRATTVARIMTGNGVNPERIISSGRGEFHPVASNETAYGRQLNRRTEIVLSPKLDKLWKLTEGDQANK